MEQKRPRAALLLPLGAAMAALHIVDLLFAVQTDTGFAAKGSVWLRIGVWLAALLLPYLAARRAAAQPTALADTCPPLGVCMVITGALLGIVGALGAASLVEAGLSTALLQSKTAVLDALTPLAGGAWLIVYGVRAFTGYGIRRERLGLPLLAFFVPLCFLWRLVWRFQFVPASLDRMPCTLRVLSAAAALLFSVVLLKVFLVPGLPCGHTLFASGLGCFLLCAGLELPQTLFEAACGTLTLSDFLTGLALGAFGFCGLTAALPCCGESAE